MEMGGWRWVGGDGWVEMGDNEKSRLGFGRMGESIVR